MYGTMALLCEYSFENHGKPGKYTRILRWCQQETQNENVHFKKVIHPFLDHMSNHSTLGKLTVLQFMELEGETRCPYIDRKTSHVFLGDLHLPIATNEEEALAEPRSSLPPSLRGDREVSATRAVANKGMLPRDVCVKFAHHLDQALKREPAFDNFMAAKFPEAAHGAYLSQSARNVVDVVTLLLSFHKDQFIDKWAGIEDVPQIAEADAREWLRLVRGNE